ncbi:uncharacterized protein [Watersipora subatra]|uniref:uncharacterized protein n=1 Tax=Watersipora subatra TaxID=2589382 RepID=UPI00355B3D5B
MAYRTATLNCGGCLIVLAFISLLVALVTNYWLIIQVDNESLNLQSSGTLATYNRNRGLFKECFKDREATRAYVRANPLADENKECLRNELLLSRNVPYEALYRTRAELQVAMIVVFCLALLLCVIGFGIFCYSILLQEDTSKKWSLSTKWAGILIFCAAFCNALGMAFYHGAEYMETQKIGISSNAEAPYAFYFTISQPNALQNATLRRYSWSYALSWLAVFFEVISALCLFMSGTCCEPKKNEKEYFDFNTLNSTRSHGQRNLAYEYMEAKQPVTIQETQPVHMITDGAYHDHFQGRHFDPYYKGSANGLVESRPQYNYEEGGWNWQ